MEEYCRVIKKVLRKRTARDRPLDHRVMGRIEPVVVAVVMAVDECSLAGSQPHQQHSSVAPCFAT